MYVTAALAAIVLATTPHQHIARPRCHVLEQLYLTQHGIVRVTVRTCQPDFPVRRRGLG